MNIFLLWILPSRKKLFIFCEIFNTTQILRIILLHFHCIDTLPCSTLIFFFYIQVCQSPLCISPFHSWSSLKSTFGEKPEHCRPNTWIIHIVQLQPDPGWLSVSLLFNFHWFGEENWDHMHSLSSHPRINVPTFVQLPDPEKE